MIVFKACMCIIKRNWITLLIYFGIFTGMSFMLSGSNSTKEMSSLEATKNVKMTIINNDDSEYADSFIDYFDDKVNLKEIVETEEGISDALFYRVTEYIIVIPKGFGEAIKNGEEVELEKYEVAGSYVSSLMDNEVNEYVSKLKRYGISVQEDVETEVAFLEEQQEEPASLRIYNFTAYALMAIIILGVSTVLSRFSADDLRNRNMVSPMSPVKQSILQILSCIIFTLIVWAAMAVITVVVIGMENIGKAEIAMLVNMFIYSLLCLGMGFLVGTLIRNENGRTIVANVVALGFSFLGGVMVPIEFLGNSVKIVGSFTPTYWFTKVNEIFVTTSEFSMDGLLEAWKGIGIIVLFMTAFFAVALATARRKYL